MYGYKSGWSGSAYSFWCPKRRNYREVKSAFFAQVDQRSEQVDVDARTWMTRYVRLSLKGKVKNSGESDQKDTPRTTNMANLAATDSPSNANRKAKRSDSLVRGGTGRYAEDLGDCVATEKGLLKRDDFQHIQKIIEVYSKALLAKLRDQH